MVNLKYNIDMDCEVSEWKEELPLDLPKSKSNMRRLNKTAWWRQVTLGVCASYMYGVSYGFALGYSSPAIPSMLKEGIIIKYQAAWFVSVMAVGSMLGIIAAGWSMHHIGRQKIILFSCIPTIIAWIMIIYTDSILWICIGRVLNGLGAGACSVVGPVYIAEVADKHLRGKLSALASIGTTSGILMMYSLGLVLPWRWLATIALIPAFTQFYWTCKLPETPRYLLLQNKQAEALLTLQWLWAQPSSSIEVQRDFQEIEAAIVKDSKDAMTWYSFSTPSLLRPLVISVMIMIFHSFCGIGIVVYYTQTLFEDAGFKGRAGTPAVILAFIKMTVTCCTTSLLDRAGRKVIFAIGGAIMSFSCTTFGFYFYLTENHLVTSDISWLSLTSAFVYITAFSMGWNSIPWLIMSEIFPAKARGKACTIASLVCACCSFIVTSTYFHLQTVIHLYGIFWIFATFSLLGAVFVIKYLPETKGRTLEEITAYFQTRR